MRTVDLMVAVREVRTSCCFNVITVMLDIYTQTLSSIPKILKALFSLGCQAVNSRIYQTMASLHTTAL